MSQKLRALRFSPLLLAAMIVFCLAPAAGARSDSRVKGARAESADVQRGVNRLQQWYDAQTGLWRTGGWWNAANSLTVLIDFSRATRSLAYEPVFANTFAQKAHKDFLNGWFDDEGWWALAWIDAYDLTGRPEYLAMAKTIFADTTGGWDQTCGGGIWWNDKRKYKNAIANELYLSVAAHLANRTEGAERQGYLDWAEREWKWFAASGMMEGDHLISDGLDGQCHDNHATKWTYNQGVILGGLAELARAAGDRALLDPARQIADAAMEKMTGADGLLHEKCEPNCSGDGKQFKGIFVRNLAAFDGVARDKEMHRRIGRFIEVNARSIMSRDQTPNHGFGQVWSGPVGPVDAVTQTAALDALVADLELKNRQKQ